MAWRSVLFLEGAVLFGALSLILCPQVSAGDRVRAGDRNTGQAQPTTVAGARAIPVTVSVAPVTISVAVTTPSKAATEEVYVNLRGPDGQVRRFPIEGGQRAIQAPTVVVLRPGQSVTIQMAAAK
jgi:hypothetical protein